MHATRTPNARDSRIASEMRGLHRAVWAALAVGAFFSLINSNLPLVRNALTYAKAALGIVQNSFDVLPVARDTAWTSGKPILFSLLAAPLVWMFDVNAGVIIASAIGTAFFLLMSALALRRVSARAAVTSNTTTLAFSLVAFNPLTIYQFWSGYPDALFAGLVLLAFILTDIIATEPERDTRWHIAGLGGTILLAIHTKLYGAVLGLSCPLYLLMHGRQLAARSSHRSAKLALLVLSLAVLAAVLLSAKLDYNPLLSFDEDAGAGGFALNGVRPATQVVGGSLFILAFALALAFHVTWIGIALPSASRALAAPSVVFFGIYVAGLLTFEGTSYNMRYFLPVFPLVAFALAAGIEGMGKSTRRALLALYSAIALLLVLNFNYAPVEEALRPVVAHVLGRRIELLDNLRLPAQVDVRRQIDWINQNVASGSVLYWASNYYGTATHGLAEHLGVKTALDIRYVQYASQIPPSDAAAYVVEFTSKAPTDHPTQLPAWAHADDLGNGLFRLVPFWIECASPCDLVPTGSPVHLRVRTSERSFRFPGVQLIEGGRVVDADRIPPFEFTLPAPPAGRHEFVVRATGNDKHDLVSAPLVIQVGTDYARRAGEAPRGRIGIHSAKTGRPAAHLASSRCADSSL